MLPRHARDESRNALAAELAGGKSVRVSAASSSMRPVILPGDVLTISRLTPDQIQVGDILLLEAEGEWIVHRLLAWRTGNGGLSAVTRGDNGIHADPHVPADAILGKVTGINRNGRAIPMAGQSPKTTMDQALLLASFPCPGTPARESDIIRGFEWKPFIEAAVVEGLAPLIYFSNRPLMAANETSSEWAAHLQQAFLSSLARAALFLQDFRDMGGILAGIDFIPLKGVYLASHIYSSPALRPFSDIDILVRPMDFEAAARRLAQAGFRQEGPLDSSSGPPRFSAYLNSATFKKRENSPSIHMHWHLLNSTTPFNLFASMDMRKIWQAARRTPEGWLELCPEHLLIHLAAHAMVHSFDRLILLRDIAEVMEKCDGLIDWSHLVRDCRAFNLSHPVYCTLLTVSRETGAAVPSQALTELRPARTGIGGRIFTKLTTRGIRRSELSGLAFFDQAASFKNRSRFLWRMLFPPRGVLAHAYGRERREITMTTYAGRLWRGLGRAARSAASFAPWRDGHDYRRC